MFWGAKKFLIFFLKNILATALKSYIIWLLYFFFLKKFEKVEKTGIISTKFLLRCTPSVILGLTLGRLFGQCLVVRKSCSQVQLLLFRHHYFPKGF